VAASLRVSRVAPAVRGSRDNVPVKMDCASLVLLTHCGYKRRMATPPVNPGSGICTLNKPTVIAVATDPRFRHSRPTNAFSDPMNLPAVVGPLYGQDLTSSYGRTPPGKYDQGKTVVELEPKMRALLKVFATDDTNGITPRLFNTFLQKSSRVRFFDDRHLNHAVAYHDNIKAFCRNALGAPSTGAQIHGKIRIHQALKAARWDINKMVPPRDLSPPALYNGSKYMGWGDWTNGLALVADGIQYAYCIATRYCYDSRLKKYTLAIRFVFYDVFGLDDEDLRKFGAAESPFKPIAAMAGITAWWQLQHQHGYAPLITRMIVDRNYEVAAV
jgi:hypothetical protein